MKKAIVVGASSGIGHEVARLLIAEGWAVGVAARRIDKLTDLQAMAPERVYTVQIDVTNEDAETSLLQLIERMNGIDLYFHAAGIGWQNPSLNADIELKTMETNAVGFTRMIGCAYRYLPIREVDTSLVSLLSQEQKGSDRLLLIVQQRRCRTPIYKRWNNSQLVNIITSTSPIFVLALLTLPYSLVPLTFRC